MKATTKSYLFIGGIFVAAMLIISIFLPREKAINIEFTLGQPWTHEQLTATFDFAVEKSEATLLRERAEIMASQRPYFVKELQVGTEMRDSFNNFYHRDLYLLMRTSLRQKVEQRILEVYANGIIATNDLVRLQNDSIENIMLIGEANIATLKKIDELYTVQQAYESLMAIDTTAWGRYTLQSCNLNNFIHPNIAYDKEKSEAVLREALASISPNSGVILAGQKIIGSGEMVDETLYQALHSYQQDLNKRAGEQGIQMTLVGQVMLIILLIGAYFAYLYNYRHNYLYDRSKLLFLITQLILFPVSASWILAGGGALMIIPFAMAPVMINVFLDSRTAYITHTYIILITSLIVPDPFIFVLLQLTAGIAAIYSLTELTERSQIFRVAFIVIICYSLVYFGYELITKSAFAAFDRRIFTHFLLNGVLLLFTYPLMLLYEKIFRFTSDVTLVELSNINTQLLRMLSENAPGTFQHSMQVSNLAAAAANKVGASSLMVRTGALYHDIGKLENPVFFTENQGGTNPHACLPYEQSAHIIINHVHDGLRLADKHHLPEAIKDFISTHHGKSKAKYFYISYKNEHPGEEVDESLFTYPGPAPFSMETAILMMADAVEAASRSLPEYTDESIANIVDRVIDSQVLEGNFKECPITFKDINDIKNVFKEKLRTIYHTRISYPELKK
ncbi:MAG: HDIG domain-containing protein [Bacteroidaceae bacterium]|nr:HDIG domain-containing protein [Bacteroidaceae bacterium]